MSEPEDPREIPPLERALAAVGRTLVTTGRFVGRRAAKAYHSVDPDLRRHVAHLPLLGYTLLSSGRDPIVAGEPDGHPPLLLVHGLGGSRGDFLLMAAYLHLHGRRRSFRIQFDGTHGIAERAEALADFVREVLQVTGEPEVDLVAHSLGGLILRLALCDYGLADCARLVITLGTPYAGTYPARYADTPITRELRPDSPLVRRLSETPWPSRVRGVSFWSRSDMLVLPPESAALPGTEAVEVTPFSHYSYLIDPRSWALVREQLERFAPTTAAAAPGESRLQ
ncbi:MAG: alpha/beta fold hydrolase [Deltaproteobacteria bacterium]|jgi:triacylglycerol esterase/lipase EstA (alpha/beta hydrolase family)|nr:alpha/beta fold hydrolase [Deltaproteobacteria bacterium]MBW2531891.1 alpha/beta fold hydrolase [Deltaproteobacteria bacterium]